MTTQNTDIKTSLEKTADKSSVKNRITTNSLSMEKNIKRLKIELKDSTLINFPQILKTFDELSEIAEVNPQLAQPLKKAFSQLVMKMIAEKEHKPELALAPYNPELVEKFIAKEKEMIKTYRPGEERALSFLMKKAFQTNKLKEIYLFNEKIKHLEAGQPLRSSDVDFKPFDDNLQQLVRETKKSIEDYHKSHTAHKKKENNTEEILFINSIKKNKEK